MEEMGALEHLRAHIETEAAEGLQTLSRYRGNDWWQLSVEEEAVFDFRLDDMPRLVAAIEAFDAAVGLSSADPANDPALTKAIRAEFPVIAKAIELKDSRGYLSDEFVLCWREFAELLGISHRTAFAFYWKLRIRELRYDILIISENYERPGGARPRPPEIDRSDDSIPF